MRALLIFPLAWLGMSPAGVFGTTSEEAAALEELRRCSMLANANQRLRCYDGVLIPDTQIANSGTPDEPTVPSGKDAAAARDNQTSDLQAPKEVGNADKPVTVASGELIRESVKRPIPVTIEPAPPQAVGSIDNDQVGSAPSNSETESFGLDPEPLPERAVQVLVVAVEEDLLRKKIFRTEDGQLWVQTGTRKFRYGELPFEARIRRASMGSFFLSHADGGASVRVKRRQ